MVNGKHRFIGAAIGIFLASVFAISVHGERPRFFWGCYRADTHPGLWGMNPDGAEAGLVVEGAKPWNQVQEGKVNNIVCMAIDNVNRHIYFGQVWPGDGLLRVNMDGSGLTNIWASRTTSVELDVAGGKVYFGHDALYRANFDMSEMETLYAGSAGGGIGLDIQNGHIYWSGDDAIKRANLTDGSEVVTLVDGIDRVRGMALDLADGKMYWATRGDGTGSTWLRATVQRANLDGTNVEILLKGTNAEVEAPMTANFSSPEDIVLHKSEGVFYVGGVNIIRAAMDGSGSEVIVPDFGEEGGGVDSPQGMALYLPLPEPTVIKVR